MNQVILLFGTVLQGFYRYTGGAPDRQQAPSSENFQ